MVEGVGCRVCDIIERDRLLGIGGCGYSDVDQYVDGSFRGALNREVT